LLEDAANNSARHQLHENSAHLEFSAFQKMKDECKSAVGKVTQRMATTALGRRCSLRPEIQS